MPLFYSAVKGLCEYATMSRAVERWKTKHLVAERLQPRHFLSLLRMHQEPRVMATLGGLRSHEETRLYLKNNLDHWRAHGHGIWIFSRPGGGQVVGRGGIRFLEVEGETAAAISYALSAEHWGAGLGTEIAQGLVGVAFEKLGLEEVIAAAYPHNLASRRVMEKAGLRYERDVIHGGEPHVLYRLCRDSR
jgi:ribosomal-protein-alanine N-acetyltransferase